jgi:hypothetical protein
MFGSPNMTTPSRQLGIIQTWRGGYGFIRHATIRADGSIEVINNRARPDIFLLAKAARAGGYLGDLKERDVVEFDTAFDPRKPDRPMAVNVKLLRAA